MFNVEWKPIENFEGYYEVSNHGEIKSLKRLIKHNGSKNGFQKIREKILRQRTGPHGYKSVILSKDAVHSTFLVHRLVATAFCSNPFKKEQVNHIDGNKMNNNAENLNWVTQSENVKHTYQKIGHKQLGVNHRQAKRTDEEIKECIQLYKTGNFTKVRLGEMYEVSESTVHDWVTGKCRLKWYQNIS